MSKINKRNKCQICSTSNFKYTCSACMVIYCSVPCFKRHKEACFKEKTAEASGNTSENISSTGTPHKSTVRNVSDDAGYEEPPLEDPKPLRPLTSLNWPYIPEESAYPDPLKRDDPKTLQIHHYEAIATSLDIRRILSAYPNLRQLLTSIDSLRGDARERALQRALGISEQDVRNLSRPSRPNDDVLALRELAEAVEAVVRGGQQGALGLDWDSGE